MALVSFGNSRSRQVAPWTGLSMTRRAVPLCSGCDTVVAERAHAKTALTHVLSTKWGVTMSDPVRKFKVLVASPGDTAEERRVVREAIDHVNRDHGDSEGYLLVPMMWETDASPGVGSDGQDVINQQLTSYDIFIGLLSARFGTSTKRANSGTEEEFGNAFERYITDSSSVSILFYFRNTQVKVHDIGALLQAVHVCQFRIHLEQLGVLYQKYDAPTDLAHKLRGDLPRRVRELMNKQEPRKTTSQIPAKPQIKQTIVHGDWTGTATKRYPQGANYLNLVLAGYPDSGDASSKVIRGRFQSRSPYFRFGFKLLPLTAKPFGEGSIQTDGPNLVVHLAKDHENGLLYLTTYENGRRSVPFRKDLFGYAGDREIDVALIIVRDGSVQLQVDGKSVWEGYVSSTVQDRVLVLGWGDYFDFEVNLRQIQLEFA
jgi:hypothetical protein